MIRFFILFILAGCTHIAQKDIVQRIETPSLAGNIQEALRAGVCAVGEFPSETWWEVFEDETLSSLIEKGIASNFSLKVLQQRVRSAEASAKKARAALFPHLNLSYNEDWEHLSKYGFDRDFFPIPDEMEIPHQYNLIDLALNFSYEIDFWGKNRHLFDAALGTLRAERAEVAHAKLLLAAQIAHTYVKIQSLLAQKEIISKKLATQEEFVSLSALRKLKGVDSQIPVLSAEFDQEEVVHMKTMLEGEIAVTEHFLHALLGVGPQDFPPVVFKPLVDLKKIAIPEAISTDLLARRPDLEAQIYRTEAAAEKVGVAKADFYPSVNLLAFAGLESLGFGHLFNLGSRMGGLTPAIHLPLFKGGALKAQLKERVSQFNTAVNAYHDLLIKAVQEVANHLSLLQTRSVDVTTYENQVALKERLVFLNAKKVQSGILNLLELCKTQEDLLQEHFMYAQAKERYLLTVIDLIRSLGGGYHSTVLHKEPNL